MDGRVKSGRVELMNTGWKMRTEKMGGYWWVVKYKGMEWAYDHSSNLTRECARKRMKDIKMLKVDVKWSDGTVTLMVE